MSETNPYFLGYRQAEQERLERQAHELANDSAWLFNQINVRQGWQAVEVGCGPQGCLGLLAERVGPLGRVVGIERSADQVVRARQFIADKRFTNIDVLHADARQTGLPENSFDFVTPRLVLVNVQNRNSLCTKWPGLFEQVVLLLCTSQIRLLSDAIHLTLPKLVSFNSSTSTLS